MPTCTAGSTGLFLNLLIAYIGRGTSASISKTSDSIQGTHKQGT